jgi:hypothetical protein
LLSTLLPATRDDFLKIFIKLSQQTYKPLIHKIRTSPTFLGFDQPYRKVLWYQYCHSFIILSTDIPAFTEQLNVQTRKLSSEKRLGIASLQSCSSKRNVVIHGRKPVTLSVFKRNTPSKGSIFTLYLS